MFDICMTLNAETLTVSQLNIRWCSFWFHIYYVYVCLLIEVVSTSICLSSNLLGCSSVSSITWWSTSRFFHLSSGVLKEQKSWFAASSAAVDLVFVLTESSKTSLWGSFECGRAFHHRVEFAWLYTYLIVGGFVWGPPEPDPLWCTRTRPTCFASRVISVYWWLSESSMV